MLAIGVFAQGSHMWSYFGHQLLQLRRLRDINHLLHHIVGILILHHDMQGTATANHIYNYYSFLFHQRLALLTCH